MNLERTNLGALTRAIVPEPVDLVTIDVSYLALAYAVPQLEVVSFAPGRMQSPVRGTRGAVEFILWAQRR